jgi:hypothetical protein
MKRNPIFLLWNPKVHYRVYKSLKIAPVLTLCESFPILSSPSHFNIMPSSEAQFFQNTFVRAYNFLVKLMLIED